MERPNCSNFRMVMRKPYPLPDPVSPVWVGRSEIFFFFLTSKIPFPLNLIVNSPNIGNKTKYANNAN